MAYSASSTDSFKRYPKPNKVLGFYTGPLLVVSQEIVEKGRDITNRVS